MQYFSSDAGVRSHLLGIEPGEYMMESINKFITEKNIRTGAVVSGMGSIDHCIMHMVSPEGEKLKEWHDYPLELCGMAGIIADGEPHIHIVVSEAERALSGHPHDGCRVQFLVEVVILEFLGMDLTRIPREPHGIEVLSEKNT